MNKNPDLIYKEIPGFKGYYACSDGTIWSTWSLNKSPWKQLKGRKHKSGHIYIRTKFAKHQVAIHHLILFAFDGPKPENQECRHLNGNHADNRPDNLKWGTRKENIADSIKHGTHINCKRCII